MPEIKTYTLDQLSTMLSWNKHALKVVARKMDIDPAEPIEEEDAAALAARLKRPWPVEK
jgi:hypothetical protein